MNRIARDEARIYRWLDQMINLINKKVQAPILINVLSNQLNDDFFLRKNH